MSAVAFDTLKLARKLRETAHMSQDQAEGVADALAEAMSGAELATKTDVILTENSLKAEIADVRAGLKAEIADVKAELKAEIADVKAELKAEIAAFRTETSVKFAEVHSNMLRLEERIERRAAESEAKLVRWVIATGVATVLAMATLLRTMPH